MIRLNRLLSSFLSIVKYVLYDYRYIEALFVAVQMGISTYGSMGNRIISEVLQLYLFETILGSYKEHFS